MAKIVYAPPSYNPTDQNWPIPGPRLSGCLLGLVIIFAIACLLAGITTQVVGPKVNNAGQLPTEWIVPTDTATLPPSITPTLTITPSPTNSPTALPTNTLRPSATLEVDPCATLGPAHYWREGDTVYHSNVCEQLLHPELGLAAYQTVVAPLTPSATYTPTDTRTPRPTYTPRPPRRGGSGGGSGGGVGVSPAQATRTARAPKQPTAYVLVTVWKTPIRATPQPDQPCQSPNPPAWCFKPTVVWTFTPEGFPTQTETPTPTSTVEGEIEPTAEPTEDLCFEGEVCLTPSDEDEG